jgi:hypothetical protein
MSAKELARLAIIKSATGGAYTVKQAVRKLGVSTRQYSRSSSPPFHNRRDRVRPNTAPSRVCQTPFSDPTAQSKDRFGYDGA